MDISLDALLDFLADTSHEVIRNRRGARSFSGIHLARNLERTLQPGKLYVTPGAKGEVELGITPQKEDSASVPDNSSIIVVRGVDCLDLTDRLIAWCARIEAWDREMELSVANRRSDQILLDISEEILGLPIAISGPLHDAYALTQNHRADDRFFQEIATNGSLSPSSVLLLESYGVFGTLAEDRRVKVFPPNDSMPTWHMNRHFRKQGFRHVFVTAWCPDGKPSPGKVDLFDHFCEHVQRLHDAHQHDTNQGTAQSRAFAQLLSGEARSRKRIAEIAELAGIGGASQWMIGVFGFAHPERRHKRFLASSIASQVANAWGFMHEGKVVVAAVAGESSDRTERALADLAQNKGDRIGLSNRFESLAFIEQAYNQALFALDTGLKISEEQVLVREFGIEKHYPTHCFAFRDYEFHHLMRDSEARLEGFQSGVSALLKLATSEHADDRRKLAILHAYVMEGGSTQRTAERLDMHRNSVSYQIRAIEQRLGTDITSPSFACNAMLAFAALEMQGPAT